LENLSPSTSSGKPVKVGGPGINLHLPSNPQGHSRQPYYCPVDIKVTLDNGLEFPVTVAPVEAVAGEPVRGSPFHIQDTTDGCEPDSWTKVKTAWKTRKCVLKGSG